MLLAFAPVSLTGQAEAVTGSALAVEAKEVRRWLLVEEDDPPGVGAPPLASSSAVRWVVTGGGLDITPPRRKRSMRKTGAWARTELIQPGPTPSLI
jgi:hypothetical protein